MNSSTNTITYKIIGVVFLLVSSYHSHAQQLPWQTWQDVRSLTHLNTANQTLMQSSFCPYNCRFDRTSSGDNRFLRVENGEAVIFEALNPGAITRIWMTSGNEGVSQDLDENIRVKFYFDNSPIALIDIPLPDLFNGNVPPFSYPLAVDRLVSSGGNISYVPISYSKNLKITLTNALDYKLWYQINYQQLPSTTLVQNFNMSDNFKDLTALLNLSGGMQPLINGINHSKTIQLTHNVENTLYSSSNPGWINSIKTLVDENYWDDIVLKLVFDDQTTSELTLRDFFAVGKNVGIKTQSLFLGLNNDDYLYSNFPMPFHQNATISVTLTQAHENVMMNYEIISDSEIPPLNAGILTTQINSTCPSIPLIDSPIFEVNNQGKWVGIFSELSSFSSISRQHLEGDERIYIDDDIHPTQHGTGVEDFYNGGYYFDQGNISLPLHGAPYELELNNRLYSGAYRFMLTDAIEFKKSIVAKLENGPFGTSTMCTRSIVYLYLANQSTLDYIDEIDLNSFVSTISHSYSAPNSTECSVTEARFLDEPSTISSYNICQFSESNSSFIFDNTQNFGQFRLRRLFDNSIPNQVADVFVNNIYSGTFSYVAEKSEVYIPAVPDRRWQQQSIDLPNFNSQNLNINIVPRFNDINNPVSIFADVKYVLYAAPITDRIFMNSFEIK